MTKITIDRSVVEQVLEALRHVVRQAQENLVPTIHYGPVHDAMNRLEAALAEPQEPAPMPPFPPVSLWKRGCAVCGIGAGGHAYGYACPRSDCPTRVTCGGTV